MTIKLASLRADLAREAKGDWIESPDLPGVSFLVSSPTLSSFQAASAESAKRMEKEYGSKPVPQAVVSAELGRLYAEHILHGWRGFDVPYTRPDAIKIMADPEYYHLVAAVVWCANEVSRVKVEFVEDAVKNSVPPSASASGTSARRRKNSK